MNSSSYAWVSWNDFLGQVKPSSDNAFREGNAYLGRNILQQEEDSEEFCRIDLTTGHCVALGGTQSQNIISTEVLVQRLPLHYDLKAVHLGSWKNVTEGENVVLATTHLFNRQDSTQFVQKVVPYDLEREVQFDLPENLVQGIAMNVYDEAGRLGLRFDVGDAATTLISKSVPAIKRMLAHTSIEVTVAGRTERVLSKLNGDLITVFDRADDKAVVDRFTQNLMLNVSVYQHHHCPLQRSLSVTHGIYRIAHHHYRPQHTLHSVHPLQTTDPCNLIPIIYCLYYYSSESRSVSRTSPWTMVCS